MEDIKELIFKLLETATPINIYNYRIDYRINDTDFRISWDEGYPRDYAFIVQVSSSAIVRSHEFKLNETEKLEFLLLVNKLKERCDTLDYNVIKQTINALLPKTFDSEAEKVLNE